MLLDILANALDRFARILVPGRVGGDLHDTEVDTEKAVCFNRGGGGHVDADIQVEDAVPEDEVGLPLLHGKSGRLVGSVAHRQQNATADGQERNVPGIPDIQDPLVVNHRAVRVEGRLNVLVALVRFTCLADAAYCPLRGEFELFTQACVDEGLEGDLVGGVFLESLLKTILERKRRTEEEAPLAHSRRGRPSGAYPKCAYDANFLLCSEDFLRSARNPFLPRLKALILSLREAGTATSFLHPPLKERSVC
jgi:hypothetical protein